MVSRCKTGKYYENISIHPEWLDYLKFKKWALRNDYTEGLSIERKNNNEGYHPDNCIFIKRQHQGRNRKTTKLTEEKVSLILRYLQLSLGTQRQLAEQMGINQSTISIIGKRSWLDVKPSDLNENLLLIRMKELNMLA